jgi:hypothetical protein
LANLIPADFLGAQTSHSQIEGYLEALQKEEIITEYGKDTYLKIINNEDKIDSNWENR